MSFDKLIKVQNPKFINNIYITDGKQTYNVMNGQYLPYHESSYPIVGKNITIEEYVKSFEDICKKISTDNYIINPVFCYYQVEKLARHILHMCLSKQNDPKATIELDDFEKEHCMKFNSAYIYADTNKETNENTVTYDRNSSFCAGLKSNRKWITGPGKKIKIDKLFDNLYDTLAYYLVKINLNSNLPVNYKNLKTKDNYYITWLTNYDTLTFKAYKTDFELVSNGEYNCYIYEDENTNANYRSMFETTINQLYKLKNTNKIVKTLMVQLHGHLFKQSDHLIHPKTKKENRISTGEYIVNNYGDEIEIFETKNRDEYLYNHLRNSRFYYSLVRYSLNNEVFKLQSIGVHVYRIYFDSFTCDKNDYMDKKINNVVGGLKLEDKIWNGKRGMFKSAKEWIPLNDA